MEDRRIILHIDMNSYFASVEQATDPFLRGEPVAVGGGISKRTVVATASYEARAKGVKTAMSTWEALRICPDLIVVEGDMSKYVYTSEEIVRILREYTDLIEVFSIDESFMDITRTVDRFGGSVKLCRTIKQRIKEKFNLTCSIGIGPNKLVAKVASDMQKPDGLVIIHPQSVEAIFEDLPVKELCGIGRKLEAYLAHMGIKTCGQLGRYPVDMLIKRFGKVCGINLSKMGRGEDDSLVDPGKNTRDAKSVSHSYTLPKDVSDRNVVNRYLLQLCEQVGRRARKSDHKGNIISLYLRFGDFTGLSRQKNIKDHIDDGLDIYNAAQKMVVMTKPVRLVGIALSGLVKSADQLSLLEDVENKKKALSAVDEINNRFGEFTLTRASIIDCELQKKCGMTSREAML